MDDPSERQSFGALLRSYRSRTGLTREELAERAGLSRRGIADLEPLDRVLAAALKEVGGMIATAEHPAQARREANDAAGRLIGGLLTTTPRAIHYGQLRGGG